MSQSEASTPRPPQRARGLTAEARCELLLEISRRSRGTLDLSETLDLLLDAVATVLDYDAAGIFALNEELHPGRQRRGGLIAGIASRGFLARPEAADAMLASGRGLVGHAIRTGRPLLVPDVSEDPRYVVGRLETRSEVVVPIAVDGRTLAALNLESDQIGAYDARDLAALAFFAEAAAMAISKAMLHRHLLELQREKSERDLQLRVASEVQAGLLPHRAPEIDGYEIAGRCLPSLELGGDYYDYLRLPDGRLGLVIADVAGKGIPAALIMATFRALLRARLSRETNLAETVSAVGKLLRESASHRAFVTCCFALLDQSTGALEYASCGHPLGLLDRRDGNREELANCGPALGAFEEASYVAHHTTIAPGDRLVLYTDGLTEALDPDGEPLGLAPLFAALDRAGEVTAGTASQLIDDLVTQVHQQTNTQQLADDLTLVVLQRLRPR